ncbi:MAG: aminopeptidase P family protein [Prevotella sp.]|jgi:Xaa-Pro aminopeptidase|nr:aminopeptidase P family protein [Prevotella sp.]MBP7097130.1 aminopeptidase P family protein [Prevotella sp.]MBP8685985.1 aminopeptidase P family protein [Prevotella sp.]MBP8934364.1 aminopeptidase P family protein [Prevotella sp.]
MTINERVAALREVMVREKLGVFIFPSTDAHNSEYVADHWKGREWISGFDGSAGVAVVTMHGAALWTDSRYFLAAEKQLGGTEFQLMKLKMPGTPTLAEWIGSQLDGNSEVGVDGTVNSYSFVENLISDLRHEGGITVRLNLDPLKFIWKDRPSIPNNKVVIQPLEYTGEDTRSKITRIKSELHKIHCDGMLVSALDDIAWILNLRGTDVHCNPVFVSYLLIEESNATLFINKEKITGDVMEYLENQKISVQGYDDIAAYLKRKYFAYNIILDPDETNSYMVAQVDKEKTKVVFAKSPVPRMKAVKSAAEIKGFHDAMLRDGVAMVKFLKWLKPAVEAGGETEMSLDRKLTGLRAEQKLFKDISFDTIVGYEQHGAIVHYEATEETDIPVNPSGLVLIDSGAQYQDGTTDITRTIALGALTEEQKKVYTLVLKGHIQLELAKFPDGACGTQLDALAREAMWREGMNFLHGTGHGVGSYLCVHEGPHQIRMEYMSTPLHEGMTVTDEPGLYLAGKFGVRIENTLLIRKYLETEFGQFLQMEPLTLCPIDTLPIVKYMLSEEEKNWLNMYHKMVCDKLLPYLDDSEKRWLIDATKEI